MIATGEAGRSREPLARAEPTPTKHPPIRPCCARCPGLTGLRRNHLPVAWPVPKGRPVPGCLDDQQTVNPRTQHPVSLQLAETQADAVTDHGGLVQAPDISPIPIDIGWDATLISGFRPEGNGNGIALKDPVPPVFRKVG